MKYQKTLFTVCLYPGSRLGKPTIDYEAGLVSYFEQDFDHDHIFEFEFMDDEFEELDNFTIGG